MLAFKVALLLSPIFLLLELSFLNMVEEPVHKANEQTSLYMKKANYMEHIKKQTSKQASTQQNDLAKDQYTRSPHHPKKEDYEKEF